MDKTKQQQINAYIARNQSTITTQDDKTVIASKADETKEELKKREKEQKEIEQAQKEQKEKDANVVEQAKIQAENLTETITSTTEKPRRFLESLPTPVGIGFLLTILLFFVFISVPVNSNGDTRLKLLWKTLRAQTHLNYGNNLPGLNNFKEDNNNSTVSIPIPSIPLNTSNNNGGQTIAPPPSTIIPFISHDFSLNDFLGFE